MCVSYVLYVLYCAVLCCPLSCYALQGYAILLPRCGRGRQSVFLGAGAYVVLASRAAADYGG